MNTYKVTITYHNQPEEEYEIECESHRKAVITLLETKGDEEHIGTITVNRLQ